jgi:hypothetical protein
MCFVIWPKQIKGAIMSDFLSDDQKAMLKRISYAAERLAVIISVKAEVEEMAERSTHNRFDALDDLIQYYADTLYDSRKEIYNAELGNIEAL